MHADRRRAWIPELDGLRGIAALLVVLAHFNPGIVKPSSASFYAGIQWLQQWSLAPLSVIFFYTLSAFLLTYLTVREFGARGTVSFRKFYARRVLRIWPLYFTLVAVNFLTAAPWGPIRPPYGGDPETYRWMGEHAWMYLAFLSNWSLAFNYVGGHIDRAAPGIAVLWSIAVEEQFYVVYPLAMSIALAGARRARAILLGALVAALLFRIVFFLSVHGDDAVVNNNIRLYYASVTYLDTFAFGGFAGWLAARRSRAWTVCERYCRVPGVGLLLLAGLGLLAYNWASVGGCGWVGCLTGIYTVATLLLTLAMVWTIVNSGSRFSRLMASPALRTLGVLSFGIYVWHPVAQALVHQLMRTVAAPTQAHADTAALAIFVMFMATTFGVASMTYGLIEQPFLSLKDRLAFSGRRSGRDAARTPSVPWRQLGGACAAVVALTSVLVQLYFGAGPLDPLGRWLPGALR